MQRLFQPLLAALMLALVADQKAQAQTPQAERFTREAMLRDIARNVLVPGWEALGARCRDLTNAVEKLVKSPSQVSLDAARQAWLAAAEAASRMRCYQTGPIVDRDYIGTFYYWQVLPARIDGVLQSSRSIDPSLLDELGSTAKGLFALEFLLFDGKGGQDGASKPLTALELLSGNQAPRRIAYLLLIAGDLEAKAAQLASDWTAPNEQGAAAKFVSGAQDSINLLVNQMAGAIEDAAERHLKLVLMLRTPVSSQLQRVERSRSGSSLEGLLATLEGLRKIYSGGGGLGLGDAVKRVNAPLEKRMKDEFETTIAATRAIGAPLEEAADGNRRSIENAYEKTRALEIRFKVDLASALGVTLTFNSNDGD